MLCSVAVLLGVVLVLATWLLLLVVILAVGTWPARIFTPSSSGWQHFRSSLWWGLAVVILWVMLAGFVTPLHSFLAVIPLLVWAVVSAALSRPRLRFTFPSGFATYVGAATIAVVAVYLAASALGPATNYDTGLYHLGAIKYSAEFGSLFGLANLYPAFGYPSAEFPLAAFLNNFFLGDQGFRALGGLLVIVLLLEVTTRWIQPRKSNSQRTPGDYVALVGITLFLIPMLWMADFWITSPAQDFAAGALAVASAAYFIDSLTANHTNRQSDPLVNMRIAIVIVGLVLLFRSTMVLWAVGMVVVLGILSWRTQRCSWWFLVVSGVVVACAVSARDFVLSGWLQYPLSFAALPVQWRAPDPTPLREATLGFHRDPSDIWGSIAGFDWISSWVGRLPNYWETYLFAALAVSAVFVWLLGSRARGSAPTIPKSTLVIALAPSVVAIIGWFFFSPPSFRFAWGMWFSFWGTLIGVGLWRLPFAALRQSAVWVGASSLVAMSVLSFVVKLDFSVINQKFATPVGVTVAIASITQPVVEQKVTESGFIYLYPVVTDQCWDVYPFCTPGPAPGLQFRDSDIDSGFVNVTRGS
jgi:hypothetical protein